MAPNAPIGLDALKNLEALPLLRDKTRLVNNDSHDVTGGNNDGFSAMYSYIYKDGDEYVLFDEEGPGCVYVVRTILFRTSLRVYLDGADEPTHIIKFSDMYAQGEKEVPPFLKPMVDHEDVAHGSSWSYIPIPFKNGCKLTTDEMQPPHFYNIYAHLYDDERDVPTFSLDTPTDDIANLWAASGQPKPTPAGTTDVGRDIQIAPRSKGILLDHQGAGAVMELKLRFKGDPYVAAANLDIRGYWDQQPGKPVSQIYSPVGTFFGLGCPRALRALQRCDMDAQDTERSIGGTVKPQSLLLGIDDDNWLYCRFPMPFWQHGRIELFNTSDTETVDVEYSLALREEPYPENALHFNAQWYHQDPVRYGEDFTVMDVLGHGHYVGGVFTFSAIDHDSPYVPNDIRIYLEGDARFYTDGNMTPLVACTGTEEYFNWGWYDIKKHDAVFTYPTHGYPLHIKDQQDHSVMYRFHIGEVAPFNRSFRFDLEHGPIGRSPANYSVTAFYYHRPESRLRTTDALDIGDADCEKAHEYTCEGAIREERHIFPYEGSYQLPLQTDLPNDREHMIKDTGRVWNGSCSFTASITPDNDGVKLRKRSDYTFGAEGSTGPYRSPFNPTLTQSQRVEVKVDGEIVRDWYIPSGHARETWRDAEFEIPARFTKGKDKIRVTLTAKDGLSWDEYTYWVYCHVTPEDNWHYEPSLADAPDEIKQLFTPTHPED